jgi:hypothetical protein
MRNTDMTYSNNSLTQGSIKITVETTDGASMTLSLSDGLTIDELAYYLKMIPKFLTYADSSIDEIFAKDEL